MVMSVGVTATVLSAAAALENAAVGDVILTSPIAIKSLIAPYPVKDTFNV